MEIGLIAYATAASLLGGLTPLATMPSAFAPVVVTLPPLSDFGTAFALG